MLPKLTSRGLFLCGVGLLLLTVLGQGVINALLGEQPTDITAHMPLWVFSILDFLVGTFRITGCALLVGGLVVRALDGVPGRDRVAESDAGSAPDSEAVDAEP